MPQLELRTDILAGREQVWRLITDFEKQPDWFTVAENISVVSEGALEEGSEISETGLCSMFSGEVVWTITEFNPVRRLSMEAIDGKVEMVRSFDLIETVHGTRLFIKSEFEAEWWLEPVVWASWFSRFRRRLRQAVSDSLENAKEQLESVDQAA